MDFYHKLSEAAGADHILKDEPMSAHPKAIQVLNMRQVYREPSAAA